jgi:hypothetical protein
MAVNAALFDFCEKFLTQSRAYRGSTPVGEPHTELAEKRVKYQDGAACSASHSFADVVQREDGQYEAYVDEGVAGRTGDNSKDRARTDMHLYADLANLVDGLADNTCRDPNACRELLLWLARPRGTWESVPGIGECELWYCNGDLLSTPVLARSRESAQLAAAITRYVTETKVKNWAPEQQCQPAELAPW